MKRKVYIALFALFALFTAGSLLAMLYISNTTESLSRIIQLYQIEHLRQDLVISIQSVQTDLYTVATPQGKELDSIVSSVIKLKDAVNGCTSCHHTSEVSRLLAELQKQTEQYENALSYYITASADVQRIEKLKFEAAVIGNKLLTQSEDMSITAGKRLNAATNEALSKINNARIILVATLFAAFILAVSVAIRLVRSVTKPIDELLTATRVIASGDLGHTISYQDSTEFGELSRHFNIMSSSLRESYLQLENTLKEWQNTFDSIEDSIVILSSDQTIIRANLSTSKLLEIPIDGIIGKKCYEVFHKTDKNIDGCPHLKSLFTKQSEHLGPVEHVDLQKFFEETTTPILDSGNNIIGTIHIVKDITEKKELEEKLVQSQKMESLGLLAGGVAHDFNNLLTAITGYSSMLQQSLEDSPANIKRYLQQVIDAADRAQNFTAGLLAFSRKQIIKPRQITLNSIITDISDIMRSLVSEDIELKMVLGRDELPVFGDHHQIEQILINLVTNARDAMNEGGTLTVSTSLVLVDADFAERYATRPGQYMLLTVSDTGKGIDRKHLGRVFEPFFTTKGKGKGTGLGLAMVYGIVKQHNGVLDIESDMGVGTTFKIYFPVMEGADIRQAKEEEVNNDDIDLSGSETILVAEDEGAVRAFLKDSIERFGYKVILANDGEDAIKKYLQYKDSIDLILLDVVMPRKNGKEVYNTIKKEDSGAKIIFMSGYTQNILTSKGVYAEELEFIPKPLEIKRLMIKIRLMLNK
ncbi:MAG: response regulator [Nitrospirae bacterium]|nr:MAG: response regulator [Nitrospirota bacterium]